MTRSRKRKLQRYAIKWAGVPAASAAFMCSSVAYAQQAGSTGPELEEIIVTAQKRSEDLQKVPISIQVLGGEKLEQLQVKEFLDFAKFMPSVSFNTVGPGQSEIYFRGISSGAGQLHAGYLPSTGLYVDETPVTTIGSSLDLHVYDIARVEGLAGPQGTLYGASSLAGTLRIITNKPDHDGVHGSVDIKGTAFAKGGAGGSLEGYINLPVNDKVAVRLVGFYEHDGGYLSNVPAQFTYLRPDFKPAPTDPPLDCTTLGTHCLTVDNAARVKKNANEVDSYGGRAALKVDLNDQWSVLPMVIYQHEDAKGNFAFDPKFGDLKYGDYRPEYNRDHWYQSALTVTGKISDLELLYSGSYFDRRIENQVDYSQYTQAYDYCCYSYLPDPNDPTVPAPDPTQYTRNADKYTKVSHEIRLSSPADWRVRFVAGAFMQRQSDNIRAEFRIDGLPAFYEVDGAPDTLYLSAMDRIDRDSAVFGELNFDLTSKLKMAVGLREFDARNTLFGFFGYNDNGNHSSGEALCEDPITHVVVPDRPGTGRPCINTDKLQHESGETHKVNLTYQVDPDHMIYATYSTGFRPGGNNRRPQALTWRADTLSNYELGWKTNLLDHRLRFNGAVFFEKWRDVQVSIQGQNGITSQVNAGRAETKGIEADITLLASDRLTLTLSGTYVKANTTTDFCKPTPLGQVIAGQTDHCSLQPDPANPGGTIPGSGLDTPAGTQLPATPKLKGNASARYKFAVGQLESFVQGTVVYQGSTTFSLEGDASAAIGETPAFTTIDLSAGTGTKVWSLEAYIQNLTDTRGEFGRVRECSAAYCSDNYKVFPIKPLNFGIKYGRRF